MSSPSDPVTVYHGPSLDRGWDDLEPITGYQIVSVTPENASSLGYPPGATGLKVRYLRRHVADVASLAEAVAVIGAELTRNLVLVEDSSLTGPSWEPAIVEPSVG